MATSQDENGSDEEQLQGTLHRRHVEALLDVSDEDFWKDLEPCDSHSHSGWEEAVHGWARVAPQSCILLTPKGSTKPKNKEAADDPAAPDADSRAEHHRQSSMGPRKRVTGCMSLGQHKGSWSDSAVAALQKDASEWSVVDSAQKTIAELSLGGKRDRETPRETPSLNKQMKLRIHSQK